MPRYIDEEVLLKRLSKVIEHYRKEDATDTLLKISDAVIGCPSADVVEVVRCKDCKHWNDRICDSIDSIALGICQKPLGDYIQETCTASHDFCSWGERKEKASE